LYRLAEKQLTLIDELLNVAQIEASVERIANELMKVNRKVNALEKVIIPTYLKQIRYIEDSLFDEELEDFARIKHIQTVLGREKT
jgi:V/A-type H+-transporting ATPase subunit D